MTTGSSSETSESRRPLSLCGSRLSRANTGSARRKATGGPIYDYFRYPVLYWRNASQVPIYDLTATFFYGDDIFGTETRDVLPPNNLPENVALSYNHLTGTDHITDIDENFSGGDWYQRQAEANQLKVSLRFRDSQNQWWTRLPNGSLDEERDDD